MKQIRDYNPKNPTEALLMRFCKRKCNFSQQSFFSVQTTDAEVWHFSGCEYFCIRKDGVFKRKNILENYKEEAIKIEQIK